MLGSLVIEKVVLSLLSLFLSFSLSQVLIRVHLIAHTYCRPSKFDHARCMGVIGDVETSVFFALVLSLVVVVSFLSLFSLFSSLPILVLSINTSITVGSHFESNNYNNTINHFGLSPQLDFLSFSPLPHLISSLTLRGSRLVVLA